QSYSTTREVVFSTPGGTTKSSGDVQDVCEEDECFHFAAGSGFPTVNEFRGYPIAVEVYFYSNETFIRGFRVFYKRADGGLDEFELAGSFSGDTGYQTESLNLTSEGGANRLTGFSYSSSGGKLSGLEFFDVSNNPVGDCLGPGLCNDDDLPNSTLTGVTGDGTDYFISGFALTVASDELSNPGQGIFAIEPTFTLV
ncbi:uncharacterized protein LOC142355144, partial [Convolutriloba macropyga]|uniref:uncharacterized protein LOC142355144 n=1 Tax=Convolutriloba macropyga TaxID=536237 RepID=UPI003F524AC1